MTEMNQTTDNQHRIDIEKLGVLNYLGELGVSGVESRLGKLAGKQTAVRSDVVKSGYVDESSVEMAFPAEKRLGVQVSLNGVPHGCMLVLFPPVSAKRAVRMMLEDTNEDVTNVSNDMMVSSIVELGGIVANGFLDALADTFDQHIATWPPVTQNNELDHIIEQAITDETDQGLYLESTFHITSHGIEVELYMFPENGIFVEILNRIDVETIAGVERR
ncbi:chemotaxis protein CheC [Haloferax namakaokahaiae]|uniref:Chemotaxis protein CheC n=1 Tax=Haloferax namakaokahaiae TaxID=1748331 RepID=A0ABD5ZGY6_9EURY